MGVTMMVVTTLRADYPIGVAARDHL